MRRVLGRKQNSSNADWIAAAEHIEEYVSEGELAEYAGKAVDDIKQAAAGQKAAYGYSAGKDSIVLSCLCKEAGVTDCFFGHTQLEFPAFLNWALAHLPAGCEVIDVGTDIEWLKKHPRMLFTDNSRLLDQWYLHMQRKAFSVYYAEHKPEIIIVGHRKADGNVCGAGNVIRKSSGEKRYAPLADWPHELILAYIHYHHLELPPVYTWTDGYLTGPIPWPIWRHPGSVEKGWHYVYEVDPTIVENASAYFESAKHFLETEVQSV